MNALAGTGSMSRRSLKLFDRLASLLKRLTLEGDLNDGEGEALAKVTDEVNTVREEYVDRKAEEFKCEPSGS